MRTFFIFCILFSGVKCLFAQALVVSAIPKELLYRAGAVVRNEELITEVKGDAKMEITRKVTLTILNKSGEDEAEITAWYDKMTKIKSIKGMIYDEYGKPLGKILEKSFKDYSAVSGYSLFEDDRIKNFVPAITTFPYTVEYEIVLQSSQTLWFPTWRPAARVGVAIEHASYTLMIPADFKIRYKEYNCLEKPLVSHDEKGSLVYKWSISNRKASREEPFCNDKSVFNTSVAVVPYKFSYDGVTGEFTDWQSIGKWINSKLLSDRGTLPEETKAKIIELTKSVSNPKEKAKMVYEYMQQKTRYISVQIGIGGFRPMLVADVDKLGYGDCKALSFYTKSLLEVVGIPSYYCIVYADHYEKRNAQEDFANMLFGNHAILCLPFPQDTVWLECTDQKQPFGYLGNFTDDRTVLACTPDGGKLLHTTWYKPEMNKQLRQANIIVDTLGNLTGTVHTTYEGTQFDVMDYYSDLSHDEMIKGLTKRSHVDNLTIKSVSYNKNKSRIPSIKEDMQIEAYNYGAISGKRMYLLPNVLNRKNEVPKEVTNRMMPVVINHGYTDTDEITITLPAGYKIEYMPESRTDESVFGKYTVSIKQDGNKLLLKRTTLYNQGTYPPEAYSKLVDFYSKIYDTDNKQLILVKE